IQGDFQEESTLQELLFFIPERKIDLLLSDMSPNITGMPAIDNPSAMYLAELALDLGNKLLKRGGVMLIKIFHGVGFDELIKTTRQVFEKVIICKPEASRARSRETYLLAKGYN